MLCFNRFPSPPGKSVRPTPWAKMRSPLNRIFGSSQKTQTDPGGMARGVEYLKPLPADQQLSLLEKEVEVHLGHVDAEHPGHVRAHLLDVRLFLLVNPDEGPLFPQGQGAFHVVRVPVGQEDTLHLLRLNPVLLHGLEQLGQEGLVARIDQTGRLVGPNHEGIAVVRPDIPPGVGEELVVDLHLVRSFPLPAQLPVRCSCSGCPWGKTGRSCERPRRSPDHTHGSM